MNAISLTRVTIDDCSFRGGSGSCHLIIQVVVWKCCKKGHRPHRDLCVIPVISIRQLFGLSALCWWRATPVAAALELACSGQRSGEPRASSRPKVMGPLFFSCSASVDWSDWLFSAPSPIPNQQNQNQATASFFFSHGPLPSNQALPEPRYPGQSRPTDWIATHIPSHLSSLLSPRQLLIHVQPPPPIPNPAQHYKLAAVLPLVSPKQPRSIASVLFLDTSVKMREIVSHSKGPGPAPGGP